MVLKGLPESFNPFAVHVTQRDETISFAEFKAKLRSYEDTEKMWVAATGDNVMKARMQQQQRGRPASAADGGAERAVADLACFKCGLKGHLARAGVNMRDLMVDCGATSHIITDLAKFKRFDEEFQAKTHSVELADGTRCKGVAERHGHAEVRLIDSRGRHLSTMRRQALYIPSYPQDIFSVKAANASGATVIFKKGKDVLIHRDGTKFHVHVHDRLYYLQTVNNDDDECDDQCRGCFDMQTWHEN